MRIVLVRHAIAEERAVWAVSGRPDSERPLIERGRKRMQKAASGLSTLLESWEAIFTSPYVRTRETAEILRKESSGSEVIELDALQPGGSKRQIIDKICASGVETALVVGHEPDISELFGVLLRGSAEHLSCWFKKGAAALFEFDQECREGDGELIWFIPPKVLRALSENPPD